VSNLANAVPQGRLIPIAIPAKALQIVDPSQTFIVLHGGRGSAKSHSIAQILLMRAATRKKHRVLCVREVQKSLKESSYQLLVDYIDKWDPLRLEWDVTEKRIQHKVTRSYFTFIGLKDHTSDSIKSYEGYDDVWCEEAHSIGSESWNKLIPTILRKAGAKFWISYNPDDVTDYCHDRFVVKNDPEALVVELNWRDNPWFDRKMNTERLRLKRLNTDLYNHVWEGKCRTVAGLIFKRKWFKWYLPSELPEELRNYAGSDYATANEDGSDDESADHTEHGIVSIDQDGEWWFRDWYYTQSEPEKWIAAKVRMIKKWRPLAWMREKGVILRAVGPTLRRHLIKLQSYQYFLDLASAGSKAERALGFAAICSLGMVHLPLDAKGKPLPWAERLVNQLCGFNGQQGRQDDAVDVCSILARGVAHMINASGKKKSDDQEPIKVGSRRHREPHYKDEMSETRERDRYYR